MRKRQREIDKVKQTCTELDHGNTHGQAEVVEVDTSDLKYVP